MLAAMKAVDMGIIATNGNGGGANALTGDGSAACEPTAARRPPGFGVPLVEDVRQVRINVSVISRLLEARYANGELRETAEKHRGMVELYLALCNAIQTNEKQPGPQGTVSMNACNGITCLIEVAIAGKMDVKIELCPEGVEIQDGNETKEHGGRDQIRDALKDMLWHIAKIRGIKIECV